MPESLLDRLTTWWRDLTSAKPAVVAPHAATPAAPDVLCSPPMVEGYTLRDWMIHHHFRDQDVWRSVVREFYRRVLRDQEIVDAYFVGVDLERLQVHFLRALLVVTHLGLTVRAADELARRHAHLHITGEHFNRVVGVLTDVLTDHGCPRGAVVGLLPIVGVLRRRLVTA